MDIVSLRENARRADASPAFDGPASSSSFMVPREPPESRTRPVTDGAQSSTAAHIASSSSTWLLCDPLHTSVMTPFIASATSASVDDGAAWHLAMESASRHVGAQRHAVAHASRGRDCASFITCSARQCARAMENTARVSHPRGSTPGRAVGPMTAAPILLMMSHRRAGHCHCQS